MTYDKVCNNNIRWWTLLSLATHLTMIQCNLFLGCLRPNCDWQPSKNRTILSNSQLSCYWDSSTCKAKFATCSNLPFCDILILTVVILTTPSYNILKFHVVDYSIFPVHSNMFHFPILGQIWLCHLITFTYKKYEY